VKCAGANACKGQSACKGGGIPARAESCKGRAQRGKDVAACTAAGGKVM
jgi:hypothetical protein